MDFKETQDYINNNKRIDISKFNKISDITNAIDFYNNEVDRKKKEHGDNEVHEISKLLARIMSRKMFFFGDKFSGK